ncbi:MAG: FAD-binding oxidoreductase [Bradymonadaceae bacterium]
MNEPTVPTETEQIRDRLGALAEVLGEDRVLTADPDLWAYNNDCSPRGIILARAGRLDEHRPAAVVQPADEEQVREVVEWARRTGVPLVPYGAGSGVCRGAVPDERSVVVDLKRLDEVIEVDEEAAVARVQPGVIGYEFERELNRRGWTMGHYPSSLYCSSVGGYAAARSAGQLSSEYGKFEDMILSLRAVTGRGEVVETAPTGWHSSDAPGRGPNPTQLMVGSEGTLGLITELTVELDEAPERRRYRGFEFGDLSTGLEAIRRLMQSGVTPTVVRLYDPPDTLVKGGDDSEAGLMDRLRALADDHLPADLTDELREGARQARNAVARQVIGRPQLVNRVIDALGEASLLVVGFEGDDPRVEQRAEWAFDQLARRGVDLGPGPGEHWRKHRFDVSYKQSPVFDTGAFVDTMEVSTTWDRLEDLYRAVRRALTPHVLVLAHFSHVYPEGSSIYFTFVGYAENDEATLELYRRVWREGLDAVAEAGGSITHHHGVGDLKSAWLEEDHSGGTELFDALKESLDPDGIMNPGKLYEGRDP